MSYPYNTAIDFYEYLLGNTNKEKREPKDAHDVYEELERKREELDIPAINKEKQEPKDAHDVYEELKRKREELDIPAINKEKREPKDAHDVYKELKKKFINIGNSAVVENKIDVINDLDDYIPSEFHQEKVNESKSSQKNVLDFYENLKIKKARVKLSVIICCTVCVIFSIIGIIFNEVIFCLAMVTCIFATIINYCLHEYSVRVKIEEYEKSEYEEE